MGNKKISALWLLIFGGCNTLAKQNISLEEVHAAANSVIRVAVPVARAAIGISITACDTAAVVVRAGAHAAVARWYLFC